MVGAAKVSYVDALNTILLVGAGVAFVGMVVALPTTIRQRDFHDVPDGPGAPRSGVARSNRRSLPGGRSAWQGCLPA